MTREFRKRIKRLTKDELESATQSANSVRRQAQEIIQSAKEKANEIIQDAERKRAEEHRTLSTISTAVLEEYIDKDAVKRHADIFVQLILQVKQIKDDRDRLEPWIVDLVQTCLRKVIGQLHDPDIVGGMVTEAIAALGVQEAVKVSFHPTMQASFDDALMQFPEQLGVVEKLATDPTLEPGIIRVACALGSTEFSFEALLADTLRKLEDAVRAADASPDQEI